MGHAITRCSPLHREQRWRKLQVVGNLHVSLFLNVHTGAVGALGRTVGGALGRTVGGPLDTLWGGPWTHCGGALGHTVGGPLDTLWGGPWTHCGDARGRTVGGPMDALWGGPLDTLWVVVWGAPMATGGTASTPHGQAVVGWFSPSTVPTGIPPLDQSCKEACIEREADGSPIHLCTACHLEPKSPVVCSPAIPLVLDGVGIGHELASHGGVNTCCCCHELMEARQPRIHV